jgi:hypothetical protein
MCKSSQGFYGSNDDPDCTALAEPADGPAAVAEGEDISELFYRHCCEVGDEVVGIVAQDAPAFARAVLARWGQPPAPPVAGPLPANFIDPEHSGTNREMLEEFYAATFCEGGTDDEITLRGINAVLARWGQPPAPPPDGEVAELVLMLHHAGDALRLHCVSGTAKACDRAAELLERHAAQVPVAVAEPDSAIFHDIRRMCEIVLGHSFGNKELDSLALWIGHHPCVLNPSAHAMPLPAPQGGEVE